MMVSFPYGLDQLFVEYADNNKIAIEWVGGGAGSNEYQLAWPKNKVRNEKVLKEVVKQFGDHVRALILDSVIDFPEDDEE